MKVTSPGCLSGLRIDVLMSVCVSHKQCQVATAIIFCKLFGEAVLAMLKGSPHLVAMVCNSSFLYFLPSIT